MTRDPLVHRRHAGVWLGLGMILVAAVLRVPTLDQPLLERQSFRQTQTAYTTVLYHEHGVELLHPKLPVLGPPYEVPFEFPLFQAIASVPMAHGVSAEVATRGTNLLFFLLTAVLLWGFVASLAGRVSGLVALAAFLFSPFGMLWSRASMMEYLATAGSVGFAWSAIRWQRNRHPIDALAALAAGSVAMLVKPTTAVFWLLPVIAYHSTLVRPGFRAWLRSRFDPVLVIIVVVPVVVGLAWTRHADAIKAAHATTSFLTSASLTQWNFGTLQQRLHPGNWARALGAGGLLIAGPPVWLAAVHRRIRPSGQLGLWVAMVGAALLPVVVLFNLYVVHDYYSIAITPQVAALFGVTVGGLWNLRAGERWRRTVIAGAGLWIVVALVALVPYWALIYQQRPRRSVEPRALAIELAQHSRANDRIVVTGLDWSPAVPYYARRQVQMLPREIISPKLVDGLAARGYRVLLAPEPLIVNGYFLSRWPWDGAVSPHMYRTGRLPSDMSGIDALGTSEPIPPGAVALSPPVPVVCGSAGIDLPMGTPATWLRLSGSEQDLIRTTGSRAALPLRTTMVVRGRSTERLHLSCAGPGSVTVTPFDGPQP